MPAPRSRPTGRSSSAAIATSPTNTATSHCRPQQRSRHIGHQLRRFVASLDGNATRDVTHHDHVGGSSAHRWSFSEQALAGRPSAYRYSISRSRPSVQPKAPFPSMKVSATVAVGRGLASSQKGDPWGAWLMLGQVRREGPKRPQRPSSAMKPRRFQLIELHSVPTQPGPDCRISNWRGSVRR